MHGILCEYKIIGAQSVQPLHKMRVSPIHANSVTQKYVWFNVLQASGEYRNVKKYNNNTWACTACELLVAMIGFQHVFVPLNKQNMLVEADATSNEKDAKWVNIAKFNSNCSRKERLIRQFPMNASNFFCLLAFLVQTIFHLLSFRTSVKLSNNFAYYYYSLWCSHVATEQVIHRMITIQ